MSYLATPRAGANILAYYFLSLINSRGAIVPRCGWTTTKKQKAALQDPDGQAQAHQWPMWSFWNQGGLGKWKEVNFPKTLEGIDQLPLSAREKTKIKKAFQARMKQDVFSQEQPFQSLTRAFAWNMLFTTLNNAYTVSIKSLSLRAQARVRLANPLLDPYFHIKRNENKQALYSLGPELDELWQTTRFGGTPSLHQGLKYSALGNAIDQYRGAVTAETRGLLYNLIDHRHKALHLLSPYTKVALMPDNAGEIIADLALAHIFLASSMAEEVTIYGKDRPYMVKDTMAAEIPYLMHCYDQVFTEIFPNQPSLLYYIYSGQLKVTSHPFTTSGLGFSSTRGQGFGNMLQNKGFNLAILKGEAWTEQMTDVKRMKRDTKISNPWPIPIMSLHVVKNQDLVFDIAPASLDLTRKPVVMRYLHVE